MTAFQNNAIFWVEVDKIKPNPFQPRREFSEEKLNELAESIRQYGVLQPLTVTRKETVVEDEGLVAEYELIAGERRHRAAKLAGLTRIPVLIRGGGENDNEKLELAIIENLQREDLNSIDKARAFAQLVEQFGLKHKEIAKKIGKSREYVSNTVRLLGLPDHMKEALISGKITEGHTRPILMLRDNPKEQETLFKNIVLNKINVRVAESAARKTALEKVRKKVFFNHPDIMQLEVQLSESLGAKVRVEQSSKGGRIIISFASSDDALGALNVLREIISKKEKSKKKSSQKKINIKNSIPKYIEETPSEVTVVKLTEQIKEPIQEEENNDELYSINSFTI